MDSGLLLSKRGVPITLGEGKINGALTLEISGTIHGEAAEELLKELNTLIDQGERHLPLDLSGIEYINCSALRRP